MLLLISFLMSSLITYASIPMIRRNFLRKGIIDRPDFRSQHSQPIVRVGGISIFVSFIITLFICTNLDFLNINFPIQKNFLIAIVLISSLFFTVGLIDDLFNLSPFLRLTIQFMSASFLWFLNIKIDMINLLWFSDISLNNTFSYLLTIFWVVAITNAINWFDGLDGLTAGIVFIYLIGLAQGSILFEQNEMTLITFIVAGSCLAFLKYNSYPADIIMGDGGSNFLGFILSILSIYSFKLTEGNINLNLSLILISIPILDMTYVIFKRIYNKRSPFYPDRNHLHHRLLNAGFNDKKTVSIIYCITFINVILLSTFLKINL